MDDDIESIETLYNELIRLNDELFRLIDFKLNKSNNIIIFDGAIIAVLVIFPLQVMSSYQNFNIFLILLIIPIIFFSFSLFNATNLMIELSEFRVIDSEILFDKYYGCSKEEILTQVSFNLAKFIKINQGNKNDDSKISKKALFDKYSKNSFKYIKFGIISLLIVFIIIILSFLFGFQISEFLSYITFNF